eukprot:TRINITY_DN1832_c0_g1_i2.p2 TRINITY_DN1832_c0_g1~~TRINITY_DN1832_c0_g1_i2.p2  ORF type:complete len:317 (-),score=189.69 TRINITY_DN1832_c0_g1_i2:73-1023(-)
MLPSDVRTSSACRSADGLGRLPAAAGESSVQANAPARRRRARRGTRTDIVSSVLPSTLKLSRNDRSFFSIDRLVRTLIFFVLLSYSSVLQSTLSLLWCQQIGSEQRLVNEPSQVCEGAYYTHVRNIAMLVMLPYVVGVPLAFGALLTLWNVRGRLYVSRCARRIADADVRYGVLYENYKHRSFLWECFILVRRLVLVLVVVFVPPDRGRSPLLTLVCFAVLQATWWARPFVNETENRLELVSLSALVVLSIVAQAAEAHVLSPTVVDFFGAIAVAVAFGIASSAVLRSRTKHVARNVFAKVRGVAKSVRQPKHVLR